jgi:hypothetical protein
MPFAEIDRFAGEQNPELRDELNHRSYEWRKSKQNLEIIVSLRAGRKMESLAPSGRSRISR